jgi:predicted nucleic acid-binding protein
MVYIDTSVIVKLYAREEHSYNISKWIIKNDKAILLTMFHELEITNAIQLKGFRSDIDADQAAWILSTFENHKKKGVYYHPAINWAETWTTAIDLSRKHTYQLGSRSLDIMHVASAITLKSQHFFTLDERQARLAYAAGLTLVQL